MRVKELIKHIEKKRWENNLGLKESKKTLKQEHYNSMTPEQRNAQAYAVFCALEGIYKYFIGEMRELSLGKQMSEEELKQRVNSISDTDDFGWQVCRSDAVLKLIKEVLKEEMDEETLEKLRREFTFMISRCGCSRASLHITENEAKEMTENFGTEIRPCTPHCTPKKCFPTLYSLLYPEGGFRVVSYMVENFRKRMGNK